MRDAIHSAQPSAETKPIDGKGDGPTVSIIVPCFNEYPHVLERSLRSVMAQSFSDFECLLIDESLKTESWQAAQALCNEDPRFTYMRPETRLGLAGSLNLGIAASRGRYLARFDSDDICVPERLALQTAFLDANPEISVLGGHLRIMDEAETPLAVRRYALRHADIERHFQTSNAIAHPTVMMRRSILAQHGGYDATFRFAEDLELWLRLMNHGVRFANLDTILVQYRQQQTRRQPEHWRYNLLARRKNFSTRQLPRRVAGMIAIGTWAALPASLQETIFKRIMFSHTGKKDGIPQ